MATVSSSAPAITVFVPSSSVIWSLPPRPEFIDSIDFTRPVLGPVAKNSAFPSSPRIVFWPVVALITSPPAPPSTVLVPAVSVIVSAVPEA